MPFLKEFTISNLTKIILWKIIPGELDEKHLSDYDKALLRIRKSTNSKEYFLAVRKILKNENPELFINYDFNGKPYLNIQKGISISHSNKIVAVGISNEKDFGIDIQYNTDKIFKIKHKFLSEMDKELIKNRDDLESLTMIWTAKESIYKALGVKGISFSKNIIIDKDLEEKKSCKGYYINENEKTKFNLNFFYVDGYTICYANHVRSDKSDKKIIEN